MLLASHAPAASLLGAFLSGEQIRTDAAALAGEALALAGGSGGPAGTRQLPDQAAKSAQASHYSSAPIASTSDSGARWGAINGRHQATLAD
jgi:hypothetical protein